MNKIISFFLACLICISSALTAVIIETPHFGEIVKYVTPKSLVILDVDDTLLIPTQTIGTDVWFIYRTNKYQAEGLSHSIALEKALAEWEAVRHLTQVKIVEEGTSQIVKELQDKNIVVMGLTTQGLALSTRTQSQLKFLGIDLARTAPSSKEYYFLNGHGVLYRQGLLSTSGTPKGPALMKLLELIGTKPEHIVFINDKATHLKDVEDAAKANGIDFIGLRYSYSDARVANFNEDIARIQWEKSRFDHILSDQEAKVLLDCAHVH